VITARWHQQARHALAARRHRELVDLHASVIARLEARHQETLPDTRPGPPPGYFHPSSQDVAMAGVVAHYGLTVVRAGEVHGCFRQPVGHC
jgi:hypothetical protein